MGSGSTKGSNQISSDTMSRNIFPSKLQTETNKLPVQVFKAFQRSVKQTAEKSQLAPQRPNPVALANKNPTFDDQKFSAKKTQPKKPEVVAQEPPKPKPQEPQKPNEVIQKPYEEEAEIQAEPYIAHQERKEAVVEFNIPEPPKQFLDFEEDPGTQSPLPPNIEDSIMQESQKLKAKRLEKEAAAKAELEEHATQLKSYHVAEVQQRNEEMQMIEGQANSILSKYQ